MTMAVTDRNAEARRSILAAIRRGLAASAAAPALPGATEAVAAPARSASPAPREPRSLVDAFRRILESVSGRCSVVGSEADAAAAIDRILDERGQKRVAVSDSPLVRAVVERLKPGPTLIREADTPTLFGCDVGITSAQWAVAETGTLVLASRAERHRLASLVPPAHIAVVPVDRLRETIAEVLDELAAGETSAAVTFVTGPSRTSDIELTLAIGVHGPGELDVILLDPDLA